MSSPRFSDLDLDATLLNTLQGLGYEQPSPIQLQSIPLLLAGKNLLGVAQTGTGKTAAFALPLLTRLDVKQRTPQILVLAPTRELAIQVAEAFQSYARGFEGFHVLPIYGGQDMGTQLRAVKRGVQVIVGTPGRIMDHLRRRSLNLAGIRAVVLDEADEMLRMGFIDDVEAILAETPENAQRALFSATMPPQIRRIAERYLGDAEEVRIETRTRTVERIRQRHVVVNSRDKLDALTRLLEVEDFEGMIVFVRTKSTTVELAEKLEARGFAAAALNGDLNQQLRERTIQRLKDRNLDIVVATDVAARGLDVERISHVINYDIPYDNESYVHRIGRTGRAGREGDAILFITPRERRLLYAIEKSTGQGIEEMTLPGSEEVSSRRIESFRSALSSTLASENLEPFRQLIADIAGDLDTGHLELAAALACQLQQARPLFPILESLGVGKAAKKERTSPTPGAGNKKKRGADPGIAMEKYRLWVGREHGVQPKDIVGAIANEADIESQYIGRIDIFDQYSTVDLPEGMPRELLQLMKKVRICQRPINMEPDSGEQPGRRRSAGRPGAKGAGNAHKKKRHDKRK